MPSGFQVKALGLAIYFLSILNNFLLPLLYKDIKSKYLSRFPLCIQTLAIANHLRSDGFGIIVWSPSPISSGTIR